MPHRFTTHHRAKILQLEYHLQKHQYFSKDSLPGIGDSLIFQIFDIQFPSKEEYPSIFYWFINVKQFSVHSIRKWTIKSDFDTVCEEVTALFRKWTSAAGNAGVDCLDVDSASHCHAVVKSPEKPAPKFDYKINITFKTILMEQIWKLLHSIQKKTSIHMNLKNQKKNENQAGSIQNNENQWGYKKVSHFTSLTEMPILKNHLTSTMLKIEDSTKIKLEIKCTAKEIQLVKSILDNCKNVDNYELGKERGKVRTSAFIGIGV